MGVWEVFVFGSYMNLDVFKWIYVHLFSSTSCPKQGSHSLLFQHFLSSLLSAIYCIFNFESGQKRRLAWDFHWGFATQFSLKLSV